MRAKYRWRQLRSDLCFRGWLTKTFFSGSFVANDEEARFEISGFFHRLTAIPAVPRKATTTQFWMTNVSLYHLDTIDLARKYVALLLVVDCRGVRWRSG